jgi:hypothetical protein
MVIPEPLEKGFRSMKEILSLLLLFGTFSYLLDAEAQQSQDFGEYVVHYNALNTNLIPPQVAQSYNIKRSPSRALLNITVLKKVMDTPGTPVKADVTASGTNLTGQRRDIEIRQITDPEGAIYYIGELSVHNMETYNFTVQVAVAGEDEPMMVKFRQQFYTE